MNGEDEYSGKGAPPRSLKVLVVYDCVYPESLGGVEKRNYEIARELGQRGHRVTLAGWCSAPSAPFEGVETVPLEDRTLLYDSRGRRRADAAFRLARAVNRLDITPYDIVEAANIPYAHLFPLAFRCRLMSKPLLVAWYEYWGGYWRHYVGWKWPFFVLVEWLAAQVGSSCTAISDLTARRVRRARFFSKEVPVVPGGAQTDRIGRIAGTASGGGPPLIYAGRLHVEKRLELLLRALVHLKVEGTEPVLQILGDGPDRSRLECVARELAVTDKVSFCGKVPASEDVWQAMGRARIAVQPSSREGFGLFPLEAMAAGLPVVYCPSAESAVPELVRDGREGVASRADPKTLAVVLDRLLNDETERKRLASNAVKRAAEFDWVAIAEKVEQRYLSMAK